MDGSNAGERKSTDPPDDSTNDLATQEQAYESDRSSSVSSNDTTELLNTTDADRERIAYTQSHNHYVQASSPPPGEPWTMTMTDRSAGTQQKSSSIRPTELLDVTVSNVAEPDTLSGHPCSLDTPFQARSGPGTRALVHTSESLPHESSSRAWGQQLAEEATRRLTAVIDPAPPLTHNRLDPQAPSFVPGRQAQQGPTQQDQRIPPQRDSLSSISDQNLTRSNVTDARMNAFETTQVAEVRRVNRLETCIWALAFLLGYVREVLRRRKEEEAAADAEVAEVGAEDREGEAAEAPDVENDSGVAEKEVDLSHDSGDQ